MEYVRSTTIFGLSDVKLYFDYDSDYYWDRQEVLNRLQLVSLPSNLSPQLSPESPIGEIYRYRLYGPGLQLERTEGDAGLVRDARDQAGVRESSTWSDSAARRAQYVAEVDARKLLQYKVTLPQVVAAVSASNANAGGNYLTMGSQSVNVRGVGLLQTMQDMQNVLITERNGVPVYLRDVADVHEGSQPRLGQVGVNHDDDAIEGIVLLQRGEQSIPALKQLAQKVKDLNGGLLPRGMKLVTLYNRTDLINLTTATVRDIVLVGLTLVTGDSDYFSGRLADFVDRGADDSVFAAVRVFADGARTGQSANLISIGAIDFGILVDASVIVLENIYRRLQAATAETSTIGSDCGCDGGSGAAGGVFGAGDHRGADSAVHHAGRAGKSVRADVGNVRVRADGRVYFRDLFRAGAGFVDSAGEGARAEHAAGGLAAQALCRVRCDGRWRTGRRCWRLRAAALVATLIAGRAFHGRRIHAQAGGREFVGARDAAAGRVL